MSLATDVELGVAFTAIGELLPEQIIKLFIDATPEAVKATPGII